MSANNEAFLGLLRKREEAVLFETFAPILQKSGGSNLQFLEELISEDLIPKERACRYWADSLGYSYVDPLVAVITDEAVAAIPVEIARKGDVVGLYKIEGTLTVAMSRPDDVRLVSQLAAIAGLEMSPVFAPPKEIQDAIDLNYTTKDDVADSIENFERERRTLLSQVSDEDLHQLAESNQLAKLLDGLIFFAIREKASDIHMEVGEEEARSRFRVDGKLSEYYKYGRAIHRAFLTRLKVLCKLNVAESRFPQDGRMSVPLGLSTADLRVSLIPTNYGNKAVLRILADRGKKSALSLDRMMMSKNVLEPFKRIVNSPNGMVFVTGPTGSGKTTTLYAALAELNTPDRNISTIEDPVEIRLEGVNQCQVNSHIDLNFGLLLRSLMRQDPDIILVGEIRDKETAKIATEAALTGHLVLSTLHTNTAVQAIIRLVEIGIEPYMVAPSILGVIGQRLGGRICESCKSVYHPSRDLLNSYFLDVPAKLDVAFYYGAGCQSCRKTGYAGRVAFHELVLVDDEMRSLISKNAGQHELSQSAARLGHRSIRYDALKKVLLGLTTIDEVEKHTAMEWETVYSR